MMTMFGQEAVTGAAAVGLEVRAASHMRAPFDGREGIGARAQGDRGS